MLVSARAGGGEVGSAERSHVQQTLGECSACEREGPAPRARKRRKVEPSTAHENGCLGGIDGPQMFRGGRGRRCGNGAGGDAPARQMHSRCVSMHIKMLCGDFFAPHHEVAEFPQNGRLTRFPTGHAVQRSPLPSVYQPIHSSVGVLVVGTAVSMGPFS